MASGPTSFRSTAWITSRLSSFWCPAPAPYRRVEDHRLVLGYRREQFVRETWISTDADAAVDNHGLGFRVHLEPHGTWKAAVDVVTARL